VETETETRTVNHRLATLLQRHVALDDSFDSVPEGHVMCNWVACGFTVEVDDDDHWRGTFAEHVAAVLEDEGYGEIRKAQADAFDKEAESLQIRSDQYLATSQGMVGSGEYTRDDIIRYGAYAAEAQTISQRLARAAKTLRTGK